jgi:hypothetical protein
MKINATVIAAALTARGYANTADGIRKYADDNYTPDTSVNAVVKSLDTDWNGDFGQLTVADLDGADDELHDNVFTQLVTGLTGDAPAAEFLDAGDQIDG